ncbi:hypothetical protein AAG906_010674 [Vitis piasezkii]
MEDSLALGVNPSKEGTLALGKSKQGVANKGLAHDGPSHGLRKVKCSYKFCVEVIQVGEELHYNLVEAIASGNVMEALREHVAQIEAYLGYALGDVNSSLPPKMEEFSNELVDDWACGAYISTWKTPKKELKDQFLPTNTSWMAKEPLKKLK